MRVLVLTLLALTSLPAASARAQRAPERAYAGRQVVSVLRELQTRGLNIIFSSEVVRPGMRVRAEPRAVNDRQILDEILKPHGLEVQAGPGSTLLVVRTGARPATPPASTRLATVRGIVVDGRSAAPLPGVLVRLAENGREVVTDQDGRFEVTDVAPGPQTLFVALVGFSLAEPKIDVPRGEVLELTVALAGGTGAYTEQVTVTGDRFRGTATGVPAATMLNSADLLELRGVLTDDPLRAVQALPGVMTGNDFRSEFSVRGSDYRHIGLSIDGVATGWPIHTVRDDLSGGSVTLINGDVVDTLTLMEGAYPQDRPARTGAWLDFTIREGSRARTQAHGALNMTSASLVLEGPVGSGQRGSWLMSARQSYLQFILRRINPDGGTNFGFTDLQGKFVYDLTPRQQLQMTVVSGRSLLEQDSSSTDPNLVRRGSAHNSLFVTTLRSTLGSAATVTQKVAVGGYGFLNDGTNGSVLADGSGGEFSYRAAASWLFRRSTVFEAGGQLQRQTTDSKSTVYIDPLTGAAPVPRTEVVDGDGTILSGYARVSHSTSRGVLVGGGALVAYQEGLATPAAVSPWMTATIPLGPVTVRAGAGLYRQQPGLEQLLGTFGRSGTSAERSRHFDLALEHSWGPDMRVQLAIYDREERDMFRLEGDEYQLQGNTVSPPSLTPAWENALDGTSRGVQVLVQRRAASGPSGWVAYSYSRTRYHDRITGETYASDFDQRHTFTAYAQQRLSPVTSVSGRLRVGSNFPIAGYLEPRDTGLFIGAARNTVRLPVYGRLDVRANHAFNFDTRRLTLFVEIVNLIGRTNYAADRFRVFSSGRVVNATQQLFPFIPTAGLSIDF